MKPKRFKPKQHDARLHAEGMVTKQAFAEALLGLRTRANLRQVDLAGRAGWTSQVVSRLESVNGRLPDLTTLARYGKACRVEVGLVFALGGGNCLAVVSALTLQSERHDRWYEELFGKVVAPPGEASPVTALEPMTCAAAEKSLMP
jgi:transcriptional regulator with XRE-family HTH domain